MPKIFSILVNPLRHITSNIFITTFLSSFILLVVPLLLLGNYIAKEEDKNFSTIIDEAYPRLEALLKIKDKLFEVQLHTREFNEADFSKVSYTKAQYTDKKYELTADLDQIEQWKKRYLALVGSSVQFLDIKEFNTLMEDFSATLFNILKLKNEEKVIAPAIDQNILEFTKLRDQLLTLVKAAIFQETVDWKNKRQALTTISQNRLLFQLGCISLLIALFAFISIRTAKKIAEPVLALNHFATEINRGNYKAKAPEVSSNEFASMENNILTMMRKLLENKHNMEMMTTGLKESEAKIRAILDTAADGIITINSKGEIEIYNGATRILFGYPGKSLKDENFFDLIFFGEEDAKNGAKNLTLPPPSDKAEPVLKKVETLQAEEGIHLLKTLTKKNGVAEVYGIRHGELFPLEVRMAHLKLDNKDFYTCMLRDITQRRQMDAELQYMASHDPLTGLINRSAFMTLLNNTIQVAKRNHDMLALLFLDLDHFKRINDNYGHYMGDALLLMVTERIKTCVRESDSISRLGGDEFTILILGSKNKEDVKLICNKILHCISQSFQIETYEFYIGCSIGIALYPEHGTAAEVLLKNADTAMYNAKSQGRHMSQFYQVGLIEKTPEQLALENDLYKALENHELHVAYQPQIIHENGVKRIRGFEALLRWQHPTEGIILPEHFIPLAENLGLITKMGTWALKKACEQHQIWVKSKMIHEDMMMAVNISSYQLMNATFINTLKRVLLATNINPGSLEIEITESILINQNNQVILETLQKVRSLGIKVAIDDFGTGYSSLKYLASLPITKLKIDRSFISHIGTNSSNNAIVDSIINLAKSIHIGVIAEGVELIEQEHYLLSKGCFEAQGYLYSKSLEAHEIEELLSHLPDKWAI